MSNEQCFLLIIKVDRINIHSAHDTCMASEPGFIALGD